MGHGYLFEHPDQIIARILEFIEDDHERVAEAPA